MFFACDRCAQSASIDRSLASRRYTAACLTYVNQRSANSIYFSRLRTQLFHGRYERSVMRSSPLVSSGGDDDVKFNNRRGPLLAVVTDVQKKRRKKKYPPLTFLSFFYLLFPKLYTLFALFR